MISVEDPRKRAVTAALVHAAGCQTVPEVSVGYAGPAIWITDQTDDLPRRAEAFSARGEGRRVLLLDKASGVPEGVHETKLTGPDGLAAHLRAFMLEVSQRAESVPV
jgi:hypothetical protein